MGPKSILIEMLKQKQLITPLEQDILDTWNELQKYPLDMESANRKIVSNDIKYPQIAAAITALPTTVHKDPDQITKQDLEYVLSLQLDSLIAKEAEVLINGQ